MASEYRRLASSARTPDIAEALRDLAESFEEIAEQRDQLVSVGRRTKAGIPAAIHHRGERRLARYPDPSPADAGRAFAFLGTRRQRVWPAGPDRHRLHRRGERQLQQRLHRGRCPGSRRHDGHAAAVARDHRRGRDGRKAVAGDRLSGPAPARSVMPPRPARAAPRRSPDARRRCAAPDAPRDRRRAAADRPGHAPPRSAPRVRRRAASRRRTASLWW